MSQYTISFLISSHIGIADSLPTTAYVKMIDIFMIFTMTIPLLEIIGHTYSVYLKKKMEELDSLYDPPKLHHLASPPGSVSISIQPLGLDGDKLENLPQIKSKLFAHDKRSGEICLCSFVPFMPPPQTKAGEKTGAVCHLPGLDHTHLSNRCTNVLNFKSLSNILLICCLIFLLNHRYLNFESLSNILLICFLIYSFSTSFHCGLLHPWPCCPLC